MNFSPEQRERARKQVFQLRMQKPADSLSAIYRNVSIDLQCQLNAAVELLRRYPRNGGPSQMVWDNERCDFLADFPVPGVENSSDQ